MSICPKNKSSKARRDKRRANWKMSAPNLVKCSKCGALMMPHRVCKSCGSYNKKEIIKGLECCQTQYNRKCGECPYKKYMNHHFCYILH